MKYFFVVVLMALSFGCVAQNGTQQTASRVEPGLVKLECASANRLGCQHRGQIYPWNAWVEAKGYDSVNYAVREVKQDGNRATVIVVER